MNVDVANLDGRAKGNDLGRFLGSLLGILGLVRTQEGPHSVPRLATERREADLEPVGAQ